MTFDELVTEIDSGALNAEASALLRELVERLNAHAQQNSKAKGELTLKIARPTEPRHWLMPLATVLGDAALDALRELARAETLSAAGMGNTLSILGNLVAAAVRRRILLRLLEEHAWNLSRVSDALQMGDAGNVTKAIVQLGLGAELKAARARGLARPGRRAQEPAP